MKYYFPLLLATLSCYAALAQHHQFTQQLVYNDPPFAQCHASTIAELTNGRIIMASFAGSAEGSSDVKIWLSALENGKWSQPVVAASFAADDSVAQPCWNPVLFQSRSGKLFLFYKAGPSPQNWWGMYIYSNDNGESWSAPVRLPENILGPIKNKPVQLDDGTILSPSSTETAEKWSAHVEISTDDGENWQRVNIDSNSRYNVIQPSIVHLRNGTLQVLCRSKEGKVIQSVSRDQGRSWGRLTATELINPNSGTDAVTLPGGVQLIVYNPAMPGEQWWNGRTVLSLASSTNGIQWKKLLDLEKHDEGEYSYPAIILGASGDIHITYTYDRKNIKYVVIKKEDWQRMVQKHPR